MLGKKGKREGRERREEDGSKGKRRGVVPHQK